MSAQNFQIERDTPQRCYEVVATSNAAPVAWPLQFAPRCWLLPDPPQEALVRLSGKAGIVIVDVEGKWHRRVFKGADVWRVLAFAADVETRLQRRECASLTLFDCPCIVTRSGNGVELWVLSSYARFLDDQAVAAASRF
jgi:hypothetical protein